MQGQMVAGWKGRLHPWEVSPTNGRPLGMFLGWASDVDLRNSGLKIDPGFQGKEM